MSVNSKKLINPNYLKQSLYPITCIVFIFERVSESMTLSKYGTANLYDFSKNKIHLLLLLFFFPEIHIQRW